jgi:hypothetical protein
MYAEAEKSKSNANQANTHNGTQKTSIMDSAFWLSDNRHTIATQRKLHSAMGGCTFSKTAQRALELKPQAKATQRTTDDIMELLEKEIGITNLLEEWKIELEELSKAIFALDLDKIEKTSLPTVNTVYNKINCYFESKNAPQKPMDRPILQQYCLCSK